IPVDQDDGLTRAVILVVELDRSAVLVSDCDVSHDHFPFSWCPCADAVRLTRPHSVIAVWSGSCLGRKFASVEVPMSSTVFTVSAGRCWLTAPARVVRDGMAAKSSARREFVHTSALPTRPGVSGSHRSQRE